MKNVQGYKDFALFDDSQNAPLICSFWETDRKLVDIAVGATCRVVGRLRIRQNAHNDDMYFACFACRP